MSMDEQERTLIMNLEPITTPLKSFKRKTNSILEEISEEPVNKSKIRPSVTLSPLKERASTFNSVNAVTTTSVNKLLMKKASIADKFATNSTLRKSSFYNMGNFANLLSSSLNPNTPDNLEDNLCLAAIYMLNKQKRSISENQVLIDYLKTLTPLVRMLTEAVSEKNYEDLLKNISFQLRYMYSVQYEVIFKYGDPGDLFYLILKGKVAILIPKSEVVALTEEEYFLYLIKLRRHNEFEILYNCLNKNKLIFKMDEDNFDDWVSSAVDEADTSTKMSFKARTSNVSIKSQNATRKFYNSDKNRALKMNNRVKRVLKKEITDLYQFIENEDYEGNGKEIASITDYIERSKYKEIPNPPIGYSTEKKSVTIWSYNHILSLGDGDKFGDFALDNTGQRRSGTILATEPCYFGILDKESYASCIKEVNEKVKKANVNFITSQQIFSNCNRYLFLKNYYNFLVLKKVNWKEKLITEGSDPENIYIIKEGEFEISMRKSNQQINEIIKHFKNGDESHISEQEREEYWNDGIKFQKFMSDKKYTKLAIIKNSDVIGLKDSNYNNKCIFNLECVSTRGEVFELKTKIFEMLCNIDKDIQMNRKVFEDIKIKHLCERLHAIKNQRVAFYKSFNNSKEELSKSDKFTKITKLVGMKNSKFDQDVLGKTIGQNEGVSIGQTVNIINSSSNVVHTTQGLKRRISIKNNNKFSTLTSFDPSALTSRMRNSSLAQKEKEEDVKNKITISSSKQVSHVINKANSSKTDSSDYKNLILKKGKARQITFNQNSSRNIHSNQVNLAPQTSTKLKSGILKSTISANNVSGMHYLNTCSSHEGTEANGSISNKHLTSLSVYEMLSSGEIKKVVKNESNLLAQSTNPSHSITGTNQQYTNSLTQGSYNMNEIKFSSPYTDEEGLPLVVNTESSVEVVKTVPNKPKQVSLINVPPIFNMSKTHYEQQTQTAGEKYEGSNNSDRRKKTKKEKKSMSSKILLETFDPSDNLSMYEEIGKMSRDINKVVERSYSRSLFDKIFQNYIKVEGHRNKKKEQVEDLVPSKSLNEKSEIEVCNTNPNQSDSENLTSKDQLPTLSSQKEETGKKTTKTNPIKLVTKENVNVVDCLVMDNFNRLYNTIYYYSDIFHTDKMKSKNYPSNKLLHYYNFGKPDKGYKNGEIYSSSLTRNSNTRFKSVTSKSKN